MVNAIPECFDCMGSTKAVLLKREAVLTSTDSTFKVEMSFMTSMVGQGGQARPSLIQINPIPSTNHHWQVLTSWYKSHYSCLGYKPIETCVANGWGFLQPYPDRLEAMILSHMPTPSKDVSLDIMLQHCSLIQASDLYKFCSKNAQGSISACREMLGCLLQGRPPLLLGESTPFLQDFRIKLQFFCRCKGKDGKDLVGTNAIGRLLAIAKSKDPGLLTLEDLEPLHTYGFLLSARAQEEIKELTSRVVARVDGGRLGSDKKLLKKRPLLVPIAAASSSSADGSQKRTKSDVDLAMELFT